MEYTEFLIQEILSSKRGQTQSFQLDNLDYVTFDLYEDGDNSLINEHGTELNLEDLSINELKTLNLLLGNPPKFDYVILSEDNQWLSFGKKETSEEMALEKSRVKDENINSKLTLIFSDHFEIIDF